MNFREKEKVKFGESVFSVDISISQSEKRFRGRVTDFHKHCNLNCDRADSKLKFYLQSEYKERLQTSLHRHLNS